MFDDPTRIVNGLTSRSPNPKNGMLRSNQARKSLKVKLDQKKVNECIDANFL